MTINYLPRNPSQIVGISGHSKMRKLRAFLMLKIKTLFKLSKPRSGGLNYKIARTLSPMSKPEVSY